MDNVVAETEHQLSERIDRAIAGEGVVITRNGKPVAPPAFPEPDATADDVVSWLAANRLAKSCPNRTRLD
jgi:hypothetical protein